MLAQIWQRERLALFYRYVRLLDLERGHQRSNILCAWGYDAVLAPYIFPQNLLQQLIGDSPGLSPSIHSIDQIKIIDRFREIPHEGPMADLVWSDPDPERDEFSLSPRGAGYTFGAQVVKKFLAVNNMNHILRAHQLCQEGFQVLYDDRLSTVWSAPNYCYRCGNMASVLEVGQSGERSFNVFAAAPENDLHKDAPNGGEKTADGNVLPDYFL
jgi:serine/threonine-protein phosphatase PPG1